MSLRKLVTCVSFVLASAAFAADAQKPAAQNQQKPASAEQKQTVDSSAVPDGGMPHWIRPETPQERRERLGTDEDPGINPDPEKLWRRFGHYYHINKYDKKWSKPTDQPGWVKAFAFANFADELYQENEKYVWVWQEEIPADVVDAHPAPPAAVETDESWKGDLQYRKLDDRAIAYLKSVRGEFTPLSVPKSDQTIKFENSSSGLPQVGSWRNSLAVADMNGDGNPDIVIPPARAGDGLPSIFLGDGKGNWKPWATTWPKRFDYGSIVAGDFNKDKKMDVALGIHLSGIAILFGDGKGEFRLVHQVDDFATRRIRAVDVDNDGYLDVVSVSEGPIMAGKRQKRRGLANLLALMNRKKGAEWEPLNISEPNSRVSGDWLSTGDLNGDGRVDFAGSTVYVNTTETIYVSNKTPLSYSRPDAEGIIPFLSAYYGTTMAHFTSRDRDDAIVTFVRRWPGAVDPKVVPPPAIPDIVAGLDRISYVNGQPKRTPIARWGGKDVRSIMGVGHGDFNADGFEDVVYTRTEERKLVILLGDGKGNFREASVEGVSLAGQTNYDLTVADVNNDKRPDVVMMFESDEGPSFSRKNGKVEVFLNRGPVAAR